VAALYLSTFRGGHAVYKQGTYYSRLPYWPGNFGSKYTQGASECDEARSHIHGSLSLTKDYRTSTFRTRGPYVLWHEFKRAAVMKCHPVNIHLQKDEQGRCHSFAVENMYIYIQYILSKLEVATQQNKSADHVIQLIQRRIRPSAG